MFTQLKFQNFRILQDATLPLGRVTVIIGPNGSGKSTALKGLKILSQWRSELLDNWFSAGTSAAGAAVRLTVESSSPVGVVGLSRQQGNTDQATPRSLFTVPGVSTTDPHLLTVEKLSRARIYRFDADEISKPSELKKVLEIGERGQNLPSVLTSLQDQFPERFNALNAELNNWLPEFDRIQLDTDENNQRVFFLRTMAGKHKIPAVNLSQGTRLAVALVTLSHLPTLPSIIALEEIDRGIHPRLLRDVQDAVNRLAFPENFGDDREPVQVIMTTHSPYFLDLYRDHPEDIVIADKQGSTATFRRLSDLPNVEEILRDSHLGEAWFSGVLGGVPAGT